MSNDTLDALLYALQSGGHLIAKAAEDPETPIYDKVSRELGYNLDFRLVAG